MKIIIAYASAGAGHFRSAEALYNYLQENCRDLEVILVDVLDSSSHLLSYAYRNGYSFLVRNLSFLWAFLFWLTDFLPLKQLSAKTAQISNSINCRAFMSLLLNKNPDWVISTHFLPSQIASDLKQSKKINSKLMTIITDFGVHSFWLTGAADLYVVASGYTLDVLVNAGIEENKIKEFGIPVHPKFLQRYERLGLCQKFNIRENKFTVLLMTGSFGLGPLEQIVRAINNEVQVLVVCAKNKKLHRRLAKKNYPNVFVFGFIDNPQELMAVSDVIVTKPGGLTISELFCMNLVPVFISAIPGQEESNILALQRYGLGLSPKGITAIKEAILDLKSHPEKLMHLKEEINKIKKPFSVNEISNVICANSGGACG